MPVSVTTGGHGNINISEILGDHSECKFAIWNAANISINSKHVSLVITTFVHVAIKSLDLVFYWIHNVQPDV